jgi:ribonuclease Z
MSLFVEGLRLHRTNDPAALIAVDPDRLTTGIRAGNHDRVLGMKVVTLGTSSGKPTLRRNVSAVAVVREGEWLLFDCGEATQTQIARAGLHPGRLAGIFITHLHGDHLNGLPGLLATMSLDRRARALTLVGPAGIADYLRTLRQLRTLYYEYALDVTELYVDRSPHASFARSEGAAPVTDRSSGVAGKEGAPEQLAVRKLMGADPAVVFEAAHYNVSAAPLDHRVQAFGYRLDEHPRPGRFNLAEARRIGIPEGPLFRSLQMGEKVVLADGRVVYPEEVLGPSRPGVSIVYCTDTRPCDAAVKLARGADLLIHEATFLNEQSREAREFGHSTAAQAAGTARAAGVRRLLLTHFSARYPDVAPLLEEARQIFAETAAAEDLIDIDVATE